MTDTPTPDFTITGKICGRTIITWRDGTWEAVWARKLAKLQREHTWAWNTHPDGVTNVRGSWAEMVTA